MNNYMSGFIQCYQMNNYNFGVSYKVHLFYKIKIYVLKGNLTFLTRLYLSKYFLLIVTVDL